MIIGRRLGFATIGQIVSVDRRVELPERAIVDIAGCEAYDGAVAVEG
jgi:hypothetical protein